MSVYVTGPFINKFLQSYLVLKGIWSLQLLSVERVKLICQHTNVYREFFYYFFGVNFLGLFQNKMFINN
jgi:hypothetical protein